MDFLRRNLEVAQEQARNAALTASQSAAGLAQQLSEHTKVLAEQATQLSNAAAEQASQRLKGLQLADGLQSRLQPATEAGPSEAEQLEYAITPHFREFIRSLTYSTFRDFPADNVAVSEQERNGGKYLTPWQEHHALLVVQTVKEINELRFVLCPKRMTDNQFWKVYFTLAQKYLPPEAFAPAPQEQKQEVSHSVQSVAQDFQGSLQRTLSSARDWGAQTGATLKSVAQGAMPPSTDAAAHHADVLPRGVASNGAKGASHHDTGAVPAAARAGANGAKGEGNEEGDEEDLEAYLQQAMREERYEEGEGGRSSGTSEIDADFDSYLKELREHEAGARGEEGAEAGEEGSGEELDLDEYIDDLGDEGEEDS